jgi:hypothetical protein
MSTENISTFFAKAAADTSLAQKITSLHEQAQTELAAKLAQISEEAGTPFTAEEFLSEEQARLSDACLAAVTGGNILPLLAAKFHFYPEPQKFPTYIRAD